MTAVTQGCDTAGELLVFTYQAQVAYLQLLRQRRPVDGQGPERDWPCLLPRAEKMFTRDRDAGPRSR